MDFVVNKLLDQATKKEWFEEQRNIGLEIWTYTDRKPVVIWNPLAFLNGIDDDGNKFDNIVDWLHQKEPFLSPGKEEEKTLVGGLRLLVQLDRPEHVIGEPDKFPWKDGATYLEVANSLKLPRFYVPVMDHSSGFAEVFHTPDTPEASGHLDFIAQNTNYNYDSWSLALSHSYKDRITTGIFCAQKEVNPAAIIDHLVASAILSTHPILLPSILFRTLVESSVQHRDHLRKDIQKLEILLGQVKDRKDNKDEPEDEQTPEIEVVVRDKLENASASYYRYLSKKLNTCKKTQASRDGRQAFWKQFRGVMFAAMDELKKEAAERSDTTLERSHFNIRHWISGNGRIFESLDGRDVNYRARIETQINVLYSLIAQRDSKLQATIAEASKQDSADMKIIAILGCIFLPANFVATMFSVERFQLSTNPWMLFIIYLIFSTTLTAIILVFAVLRPWWKRRVERLKAEAERTNLKNIGKEEVGGAIELLETRSSSRA